MHSKSPSLVESACPSISQDSGDLEPISGSASSWVTLEKPCHPCASVSPSKKRRVRLLTSSVIDVELSNSHVLLPSPPHQQGTQSRAANTHLKWLRLEAGGFPQDTNHHPAVLIIEEQGKVIKGFLEEDLQGSHGER